jgi:superfamily II DNA or RNA helicase
MSPSTEEEGAELVIELPACWSTEIRRDGNVARQLLAPSTPGRVEGDTRTGLRVESETGSFRVRRSTAGLADGERALRASTAAMGDPSLLVREEHRRWIGALEPLSPEDVRATWGDAFTFATEDAGARRQGLRRPQVGAVHAVLGDWTTGSMQPATVVMPTGTGKTETMVALLVAALLERLLVVVPSDALRDQIASKFERLGVLQATGVIDPRAARPIVGRIAHAFANADTARAWATACNVMVTTPSALNASPPEAIDSLAGACSTLFVDEAHHVAAPSWRQVRDLFAERHVVQFTATPYREDGKRLGGRIIYEFPLREAQTDGYFAEIDYTSVIDFGDPDRAIAERAIARLRQDLAAGLDHLLMARVSRIGRAREVRDVYAELAADLSPVVLHSTLPARQRGAALDQMRSRQSRIIVCVNMLGEGFDLPSLKIAAVHDPHRSLGVTLQFVGRFARVAGESIGRASVFLARPDAGYDPALRKLYSEDADWNIVIRDLSETAVAGERELDEFEGAFGQLPDEVPIRTLEPKMSTVVYRTRCTEWQPGSIVEFVGAENLVTDPIAINDAQHVAWFVVERRQPVQWADLDSFEEIAFHLFVVYWDRTRQLLYINSSDTGSMHDDLANVVSADTAELIRGEAAYRVMAHVDRLVPTNVGVLDVRSRSRRFSMHVGADVIAGFTEAEAQTKAKTNIFAFGFEDGERVSVGASLKGRVWSYRVAPTLKHWVNWCDHVGGKLADESISIDEVMRGFIRPRTLDERPDLVALAIELWEPLLSTSEELRVRSGDADAPLVDLDLRVTDHARTGPVIFVASAEGMSARYLLDLSDGTMTYAAEGAELQVFSRRGGARPFSDYLRRSDPLVLMEQDAVLVPPGILLQPNRELDPFPADRLEVLGWAGVDLHKESQGPDRDPTSIQHHLATALMSEADWELVLDDDDSGEIADLVLMRREDERLVILFAHCKFSSGDLPGARVADLYELCGQAQKSARWRHHNSLLFRHLARRERNRNRKHNRSGLIVGTGETLYDLEEVAPVLRPQIEVVIAQPGLSKARFSPAIAQLLASTDLYLRETASASFRVVCSV